MRPKLEDLFKDGLGSNPSPYLDLINHHAFMNDLKEWTANSIYLILDKCLETGREADLLKVLRSNADRLSTIKFVDLLKKILIVEKNELAESILSILIDNKTHCKSKVLI